MIEKNIRELALEAAQGSTSAFQELYRLTRQGAWFVALSITKNEHDAQDILQESYLKAYKSLGQLAQPESFVPWLNQIVANKAKNFIARKKPGSFAQYEDENAQDWQEETDPAFIPDEHLDQEEAKALIAALVSELPEDQRLVVLLRYYDDMEVAAIAKSLDIPEGTVKSRLGRARQKLAAMLEQAQGKGLKLYAMAPIPLLAYFIKLLGFDAPGSDRLPPLLIGSAAAGTAAAGGAAAAGAAKNAGLVGKAGVLSGKVAAFAAAAIVTVGGFTAAGVYAYNRSSPSAATTVAPAAEFTDDASTQTHAVLNQFPTLLIPEPSQANTSPDTQAPPLRTANPTGGAEAQQSTQASTATNTPTTSTSTSTATRRTTSAPGSTISTARAPWSFPSFPTFSRVTTTRAVSTSSMPEPSIEPPTTTEPPLPVQEYEYRVESNGVLTITKYNGTKTSIVVPAQIDGLTVRHLEEGAFAGTNLVRVTISPGIDCLRDKTFGYCPDLEEVIVPDSVVSVMGHPFIGSPKVVVVCGENGRTHRYAAANGVAFRLA